MYRLINGLFSLLLVSSFAWGQEGVILLSNPSFEDAPAVSRQPIGWYDCGFPDESPPDTHLDAGNPFQVTTPPYHGNTYLGMVVRDNETWESVAQRLTAPLKKGKCYEFTLMLARSSSYYSSTRKSLEKSNYTTPAVLRIWGGNSPCQKAYLLDNTKEIVNHRWIEYRFKFEPVEDYNYIVFEAFYKTPIIFPYNGNVLLDKAGPIKPIPCDEEIEEPVVAETPPPPATAPTPQPPATPDPAPTSTAMTPKAEPQEAVTLSGVKREELRTGQTLRIQRISFRADSSSIVEDSYSALDEIYTFLQHNMEVIVEIGGHTNTLASSSFAEELSTNRAKAVVEYLVKKGIARSRLTYKGYGKSKPLSMANNRAAHRLNQRVEIKIISLDG